jgi:putative PIN family toxin of toxin-antitoxin system
MTFGMLKLVIDTNVVISSLLKPESNPALIMSLVLRGDCTLCVTEAIFLEYEGVLGRGKFKKLDQAGVGEFLSTLRKRALWVVPKVTIDDVTKDPDDNAFLECALESKADFLITGNIHHFPEKKFRHTSIVTPGEFVSYAVKLIK